MEELCQPSLDGQSGPIAPIAIQATTFGLKNDMIQQVQNSCPFRRPGDDANKHLDNFLLMSHPKHESEWGLDYDAPNTFYNGLTLRHRNTINAAAGWTFMKRHPEECYDLIENMTAHHNDWDTSAQRNESSSSITSSNPEIASLKLQIEEMNRNLTRVLQTNQQVNIVTPSCETCGGPHSYNDCPATIGQNQNVYAVGAYNQLVVFYNSRINENKIYLMQTQMNNLATSNQRLESMLGNFIKMNTASSLGTGSLPSNTVSNPKGELKAITTQSGLVLNEPSVLMPPPFINPEEDERVENFTGPNMVCFTIRSYLSVQKVLIESNVHKELAIYGDSINLMPLSVWKELGLPELISTQMTLELRLTVVILHSPKGIVRDVFVPVGKFTFPADFVIVDYERDPRVPLILGRPFLRTARALIDVHGKENNSQWTVMRENDDLPFDAESDLLELEYLLNHDPIKDMDSILEDSVDENSLDDNIDDTISEMFTDEHALDYSYPPLWDDYDDNLFDHETVNDDTYDDPFDLPESNNVLSFPECDSVFYEDFFEVDALPSTDNEEKVFNPGILIHENLFEVTNFATPDKNIKKTTNASLIREDFNPSLSLYELPFHKEVPRLGVVLSFSSKKEEKVFNPGILTSKRVHTSLLLELSHRSTKAFKVTKILESLMEIFPCSYQEDIRVLDVPCLHFYPP
ncbi:reverse transcriptase domain-containing protein [Tanacetum coccineum]